MPLSCEKESREYREINLIDELINECDGECNEAKLDYLEIKLFMVLDAKISFVLNCLKNLLTFCFSEFHRAESSSKKDEFCDEIKRHAFTIKEVIKSDYTDLRVMMIRVDDLYEKLEKEYELIQIQLQINLQVEHAAFFIDFYDRDFSPVASFCDTIPALKQSTEQFIETIAKEDSVEANKYKKKLDEIITSMQKAENLGDQKQNFVLLLNNICELIRDCPFKNDMGFVSAILDNQSFFDRTQVGRGIYADAVELLANYLEDTST